MKVYIVLRVDNDSKFPYILGTFLEEEEAQALVPKRNLESCIYIEEQEVIE